MRKLSLPHKLLVLAALVAGCVEFLRQPIARRRLTILLAAVCVCLYAVSVLWYVEASPDIGLRCDFYPHIQRVDPGVLRLLPGQAAPSLEGQALKQIGNRPIESTVQVSRELLLLHRQAPQATVAHLDQVAPDWYHVCVGDEELVRIGYEGPDGIAFVWCRVGHMPLERLFPTILWLFLKAGLFLVAALVFWNRPGDRSAAQFFWLSIVTFGAYMGGYHWSRILTQPALLLVFMVCGLLLPAVSLHFYLIFPRPKEFLRRQPRWTLLAIYGLPVLFLLTLLSGYLRVRWLFHEDPENLAALRVVLGEILMEIYVYFAVGALWYVGCAVCLVHSFRSARDATERNQVKWILCGVLAALAPIGYTLYLAFLAPGDFARGAGTWPMFAASVCITAAFTISITRYRLMQLDQLISSGVVYFLFSSLAGLVYYAVVFAGTLVFSQWMATPSLTQALGVSSAALVLMVVLDWLRSRVKHALDRRFLRDKHHLDRTLKRMSLAIEQLVDPPTLAQRLLQEVTDLLGVKQGAVYLREGQPALYRLADSLGPAPPLTELSSGCPLIEALQQHGTVLPPSPRLRTPVVGEPALRQLRFLGGEAAQALIHEGQLLALLVLGPREMGMYGPDDVNLMAAFAQITVLALVSAEGHRTIEVLNRDLQAKVEKIAEQQRRILALQSQLMNQATRIRGQEESPRPAVPAPDASETPEIIGSSTEVRDLLLLVRKVSSSQANVLIRGESGTGKELLARALHEHSPRANKPFVAVHCAALSPNLLESELFGHVKGAFTGAHRDKVGRFELAHQGTLFLDEIGDISLEVQTKLLRVLQERTFERVGSSDPIAVDVRVLAATHRNLEQLIVQGRFREDLYYRLNVISIPVPPLRERREDIQELAQHFLKLHAQRCARPVSQIDDDALAALKAYSWPGNVRQLENVIERAVVVAEGPAVTLRELPPELLQAPELLAEPPLPEEPAELTLGVPAERAERDRREREQLVRALAATGGNKAEAARILGLARSTFVSRLKKHGLS